MQHELKIWRTYFEETVNGHKRFEYRRDDRGFRVGDILKLKEFIPCSRCRGSGHVPDPVKEIPCGCAAPHGEYTGREIFCLVKYILHGPAVGIPDGYCVMSISVLV